MALRNILQSIGSGFKRIGSVFRPSNLKSAGKYLNDKGEVSGPITILVLVMAGILYALLYQPYSTASNIKPITMTPKPCSSATVKTPCPFTGVET
jgi:hypothetical protein